MAEEGKIYKCEICQQEVKVVKSGIGILVCCGKRMKPIKND
jgi:desulfoferrodoxin-like iron-binding protein